MPVHNSLGLHLPEIYDRVFRPVPRLLRNKHYFVLAVYLGRKTIVGFQIPKQNLMLHTKAHLAYYLSMHIYLYVYTWVFSGKYITLVLVAERCRHVLFQF